MHDYIIPYLTRTFAFDPNSPLLFTQFYFWGFFAVVFAIFSLVHSKLLLRNAFLFATSLFFYYKTSGSYVCILIFCVIANFFIGKWIEKAEEKWKKKLLMIIVVIIDLLVLCYYKYSYFFLDALYDFTGIELHVYNFFAAASNAMFNTHSLVDTIILPVGISFFTFQAMSYCIDIYRGKIKAVDNILSGITIDIDTGIFNDRYFCYVSSFGIFTRTSYSTPQRVKNVIGGRLSYMLNSITELGRIKAEHMRVETNGRAYEGDFLFGAVTNSSSVGGVLKYDPRIVNMNDGKLEILLIHKPRNPLQLFSIIRSLVSNKFSDNPLIEFDRSDKFKIYPSARSDWSLDGEFAYTTGSSEIKCLKSKIRLLCPQIVK